MFLRIITTRSVFLLGFFVGFIIPIFLSLTKNGIHRIPDCARRSCGENTAGKYILPSLFDLEDPVPNDEIILQNWKDVNNTKMAENKTYNDWLRHQNLRINKIDMDKYLYGPKRKEDLAWSEADWLRSRIHVTCVVFVKKNKLAKSINGTWGKHCNEIYFFADRLSDAKEPVINIDIKLVSSWQLLCEAMNYVWNDNKTLEWIIFVNDDTIVIPQNLRYAVAPLDHNGGHYLGHAVVMWGLAYNVAQAGYVLSRGALDEIINLFNNSEKCISGGKYWKREDYYLAKHLSSLGIYPSDTRDQYLRGTFHGYTLQNLLWGVIRPGSYWTRALYPSQDKCCSPVSVTFSISEADKMYTSNYLLYHLHVLREKSIFGAGSAPTPVPEEDIWRIALKKEFNITYINDISSEAYYEIWHARYSEPGELIAKNYQSMPDVLSSVLTAYELENKSRGKSSLK